MSSRRNRIFINIFQLLILVAGLGCSNQKAAQITTPVEPIAAKASGESVRLPCSALELANFHRQEGVVVDLDRESLPKGLFLASVSELLIEKLGDASAAAHVLIREIPGGKEAEIKCADGIERFGTDFDITLTGPVKFETSLNQWGASFILRQFFFFQNREGYGAVLSSPKRSSPVVDLRRLLRAGVTPGQLFRVSDRSFVLRYVREREGGVRATLSIRLDRI